MKGIQQARPVIPEHGLRCLGRPGVWSMESPGAGGRWLEKRKSPETLWGRGFLFRMDA